jgi:hypothetical protein
MNTTKKREKGGGKWKINNCFELAVLAFCLNLESRTIAPVKAKGDIFVCETVQFLISLGDFLFQ